MSKIHVQDIAVSLLTRQYCRRIVVQRFHEWVLWVQANRTPNVLGVDYNDETKLYFDTSVPSVNEKDSKYENQTENQFLHALEDSNIDTKATEGPGASTVEDAIGE